MSGISVTFAYLQSEKVLETTAMTTISSLFP